VNALNNYTNLPQSDIWSNWLLHHRHGGDAAALGVIRAETERFADRVLQGGQIEANMTLLDVGAGDGLVAFRAIHHTGPSLRVILTDVSEPMLQHAQQLAEQSGVLKQCTFHACPADQLHQLEDESIDVIVTRAVLAYVGDKAAAFREFLRVLKPGGRISLCEPVMRDDALGVYMLKQAVDADGLQDGDRLLGLQCRIMAAQYPHTLEDIAKNPTTNYTERDLVHLARAAGFQDVHMELHIDLKQTSQRNWETFLECSPHPLAPSVKQIIAEHFSADERAYFHATYRQIVEGGSSIGTSRNAYLTASKPAS